MTEPSIAERIERRRRDEVHSCFRPGCGKRAVAAFYVDDEHSFAGRWWREGEWLDLCAADEIEMRRVAAEVETSGLYLDGTWLVQPDRTPLVQLWTGAADAA